MRVPASRGTSSGRNPRPRSQARRKPSSPSSVRTTESQWAATARSGGKVTATEPASARALSDKQEALADLRAALRPGDVVLVKASRGLALDTVAEALLTSDADLDRPQHPPTARKDPA